MPLNDLDKELVGKQYILEAWKRALSTTADPSGGEWYETRATDDSGDTNGDGKIDRSGLYGGLTDTPASELDIKTDEADIGSLGEPDTLDTKTVKNLNGNNPKLTYKRTWEEKATNSITSEAVKGVDNTTKVTVKSSDLLPIGLDLENSTTATFRWSESETESEEVTDTRTIDLTRDNAIEVPEGKVYRLFVMADKTTATIPFEADITVSGVSETWFDEQEDDDTPEDGPGDEDEPNAEFYNWAANAGEVFDWINKYGIGEQSDLYGSDGNGNGLVTSEGEWTIDNTSNITTEVKDVTAEYTNSAKGKPQPILDFSAEEIDGVGMFYALDGSTEQITGTSDDDMFEGTDANEKFFAYGGNDIIKAGGGNDYIRSLKGGINRFYGHDGDDRLEVASKESGNVLDGGKGNDTLISDAPESILSGGKGNDTLISDAPGNILYGSQGIDRYVFGTASDGGLKNIIVDFDLTEGNEETIEFAASSGVGSFEELEQSITEDGLVLSSGGREIVQLTGINTELNADSFEFV